MDLTLNTQGSWVIVEMRAQLDAFNYPHLAHRLSTLRRAGKNRIAVDLSQSRTLNWVAARLLGQEAQKNIEKNGVLAVITKSPEIIDLLDIFSPQGGLIIQSSVQGLSG